MKCPYCNQEHPDHAKFCENTGKPLPKVERATMWGIDETPGETTPPFQQPVGQDTPPEEGSATPVTSAEGQFPGEAVPLSQMESLLSEPAPPSSPQETEAMQEAEPPTQLEEASKTHTRWWLLGGCIGVPLAILLLLVALVLFDPFKLHLLGRLNGQYDAAAEVMPADTGLYVGINIGNAILTHADRVISPFTSGEPGIEAYSGSGYLAVPANPSRSLQTDPYGDLFQVIEDETGMIFPDDFTPWVGQYAGIGMLFDNPGNVSMTLNGEIYAIEVRSPSKADAFLRTMMDNMKDLHSIDYQLQTYKGVTIYEQRLGNYPSFAYCRDGRMLLRAPDIETLQTIIDRQNGQALVVQQEYSQLVGTRPRDWSASLYVSKDVIGSVTDQELPAGIALASPLVGPYANLIWNSMMVNASVIRQGARLDMYINIDTSALSESARQELQSAYTAPTQVIQMLPENTVLYLASPQFDQLMQGLFSSAFTDESEQSAFFDSLEQEIGFSLQGDLLDHLTGEWALYAVPSAHGLLADQMGLDMAVNLLARTDPGFDLQPVTEGLNKLGIFSGLLLSSQQQNGVTYYEISSYGDPNPVLAFGAANGYFTLGTDLGSLQIEPQDNSSLANASNYQQAVDALPENLQPTVYIDLETMLANLRQGIPADELKDFNESVSAVAPIASIAGAGRLVSDDILQGSVVVILADK